MNSFQNKLLVMLVACVVLSGCGDSKPPQAETAFFDRKVAAEAAAIAASAAYGKRMAEDKIDADKSTAFKAKQAEEERLAKQRQLDLEQLVVTGKVADLVVEARKGFDHLNGRSNTSLYGTATLIIDGAAGTLPYDGYRAVSNAFWLWAGANPSKLDELIQVTLPLVRRSGDAMVQLSNTQLYLGRAFDVKQARDMVASCKGLNDKEKFTDDSPCKEYDDKYVVGRDVLYVAEFLIRRHNEGGQALAEKFRLHALALAGGPIAVSPKKADKAKPPAKPLAQRVDEMLAETAAKSKLSDKVLAAPVATKKQ